MANAKKSPARSRTRGGAAPSRRRSAAPESLWQRHHRDLWILALLVVGTFFLLAEVSLLGPVGHGLDTALRASVGEARWALPALVFGLATVLLIAKTEIDRLRFSIGLPLGIVAVAGVTHFLGGQPHFHASTTQLGNAGGWLGVAVGGGLHSLLGLAGATVVLLACFVLAVMVLTGVGLRALLGGLYRALRATLRAFAAWWAKRPTPQDVDEVVAEPAPTRRRRPDPSPEEFVIEPVLDETPEPEAAAVEVVGGSDDTPPPPPPAKVRKKATKTSDTPTRWRLPDASLLLRTKEQKHDRAAVDAAGDELVEALAAHGVETTLVGYTIGPSVTRFELELGPGVKVARVTSLNKDIAYAMASPDVRILAPIPGRSAIGVEVPNRQRTLVALGDLLAAEETQTATHPLEVPIGRDISGQTVVVNLAEMPHVLISGATGAGKSSCINSLITGLVMRATPDELRLILVDPKRVELGQYNDLPHLLTDVVVDPKKAAGALQWAVAEMESRYDLLASHGVRDITSYHAAIDRGELDPDPTDAQRTAAMVEEITGLESDADVPTRPAHLPYIVIVVDELNDLMMVAARDVEDSVVRIAQMARAVGIHLVLATQRPSVDVITGVIKANIPSRMAFAVSSLGDSRVILDQAGAERLIGKGDMLLLTASSNVARRIQSPWVSEDEVRKVVTDWRSQGGVRETVVALDENAVPRLGELAGPGGNMDDDDVALAEARRIVLQTQSGSVSMLQRKMRVGFARAGRLMDMLEQEGTVGPNEGSKSRKVNLTWEDYVANGGS